MIIKRGNQRTLVILTGMLHLPNYAATIKSVFRRETLNLEEGEEIIVGIKFTDANEYLYRKDKEKWNPDSFDTLIGDLLEKVKDDEAKGRNKYEENKEMIAMAQEQIREKEKEEKGEHKELPSTDD